MKPLSPRRAREFRDRWCKRMFGMDRKARAERWVMVVRDHPDHPEVKRARAVNAAKRFSERLQGSYGKTVSAPSYPSCASEREALIMALDPAS